MLNDEMLQSIKSKIYSSINTPAHVEESIDSITDKVYETIEEAAKCGGKKAYTEFMKGMLAKYKVKSPTELSGDQKKKFFNEVDSKWESEDEKNGVEEGKKLKYVGTTEESAQSGGKAEYDKFMKDKLAKYKVESPTELSDEDKKKFFNEIDSEWTSKDEKNGVEEGLLNTSLSKGKLAKKKPLPKNQVRFKIFGAKGFDLLIKQVNKEKLKYTLDESDPTAIIIDKKLTSRVEKLAKYTGYKSIVED